MKTLVVAIAVLCMASCKKPPEQEVAADDSAAPAAPAAPPELHPSLDGVLADDLAPVTPLFRWGAPCRVPARMLVKNGGDTFLFDFEVVLTDRPEGFIARVERSRLADHPVNQTEDVELSLRYNKPLVLLAGELPTMFIDEEGNLVGVGDIEATFDRVRSQLTPEQRDSYASFFERVDVADQLEENADRQWSAWVGGYTHLEWRPGEATELEAEVMANGPEMLPTVQVRKHLGRVPETELVALRIDLSNSGEELKRAAIENTKAIADDVIEAKQLDSAPPTPERTKRIDKRLARKVRGLEVEQVFRAALDPATGRPHRARYYSRTSTHSRVREKSRDVQFDWSKAEGCVPPPMPDAPSAQ